MLYFYVLLSYTLVNAGLSVLIYFKSKKSVTGLFFLICTFFLVCFGAAGSLLQFAQNPLMRQLLQILIAFLFSVIPFMFMHFMLVFLGKSSLYNSPKIIISIYFTAFFSYVFLLLNFIQAPYLNSGGLSTSGNIFYLVWMSIFFTIGIVQLYMLNSGFSDKGIKSNMLFTSFALLLLLLPGPFTASLLPTISAEGITLYILISIAALIISVYFIIRHKTVVTLYDALKMALGVINDILIKTDDSLKIEMARGGVFNLLGFKEKEIVGRRLTELLVQKEYLEAYYNFARRGKMKEGFFNCDVIKKGGDLLPMYFSFSPIFEDGKIIGFVVIGRNDTLRKEANDKLLKSLEEKNVLLQEVHHRVKNNLQLISSLLYFQSKQITDPGLQNIFAESRNRIKAMAMVHEKLYQSDEFSKIDIKKYLSSLIATLAQSLGLNQNRISIDINIGEIFLFLDTGVKIGLLINELFTNSVKYAFPDNSKGQINIDITFAGDGYYTLTFEDNGVGMPDSIIKNGSESIGLLIVESLTKQMEGRFNITNGRGTKFIISFKDGLPDKFNV